jgi:hypothetical protein
MLSRLSKGFGVLLEVVFTLTSHVCHHVGQEQSAPQSRPDSTVIFLWRFNRLGKNPAGDQFTARYRPSRTELRAVASMTASDRFTVSKIRCRIIIGSWCAVLICLQVYGSKDWPKTSLHGTIIVVRPEVSAHFLEFYKRNISLARYFPSTRWLSDPRRCLPYRPTTKRQQVDCWRLRRRLLFRLPKSQKCSIVRQTIMIDTDTDAGLNASLCDFARVEK